MLSPSKLIQALPKSIYFWMPMVTLCIGYGFLGHYLHVIYVNYVGGEPPARTTVLIAALALAGIWALPLGIGGIFAALAVIIQAFVVGGVNGLIAIAVALLVIWIGFQDTDTEKDAQRRIVWQEWLVLIVTIGSPLALADATFKVLSSYLAMVVVGAIAGGLTTIGAQFKASGLSRLQVRQLFTVMCAIAIAIGFVYSIFTYRYLPPS
jgi:hypothetical protein